MLALQHRLTNKTVLLNGQDYSITRMRKVQSEHNTENTPGHEHQSSPSTTQKILLDMSISPAQPTLNKVL